MLEFFSPMLLLLLLPGVNFDWDSSKSGAIKLYIILLLFPSFFHHLDAFLSFVDSFIFRPIAIVIFGDVVVVVVVVVDVVDGRCDDDILRVLRAYTVHTDAICQWAPVISYDFGAQCFQRLFCWFYIVLCCDLTTHNLTCFFFTGTEIISAAIFCSTVCVDFVYYFIFVYIVFMIFMSFDSIHFFFCARSSIGEYFRTINAIYYVVFVFFFLLTFFSIFDIEILHISMSATMHCLEIEIIFYIRSNCGVHLDLLPLFSHIHAK